MSEPTSNSDSVSDELKRLGSNLKSVLSAFWESEERKSATRQLEQGAAEVSNAIERLANDVTNSETSKRLQSDVDDFTRRIRSGELESKVREDMLATLHKVNQELNQFTRRWSGEAEPSAGPDTETNPATPPPHETGGASDDS